MKTFMFKRESNDFADILADKNIKKLIRTKISLYQHLMIQIEESKAEKINAYILLMYGDEMVNINKLVPDRSPVMYKDYTPKKPNKVVH